MGLTKDQILAAKDRAPVKVLTPEWGGEGCVFLLPLDGNGRDRYDQLQSAKRWPRDDAGKLLEADWRGLRAAALAMALCDEQGVLMDFSDLDVVALGQKCGAPLDRCFSKLQEISGLGADAVEQAEKNSETGPSAGSGSS